MNVICLQKMNKNMRRKNKWKLCLHDLNPDTGMTFAEENLPVVMFLVEVHCLEQEDHHQTVSSEMSLTRN